MENYIIEDSNKYYYLLKKNIFENNIDEFEKFLTDFQIIFAGFLIWPN